VEEGKMERETRKGRVLGGKRVRAEE